MTIRFQCDSCGKSLKVDDSKAGRSIKCPSCEETITIPDLGDTGGDGDLAYKSHIDEENPYAAPQSSDLEPRRRNGNSSGDYVLARPLQRLVASVADGLAFLICALPGLILFLSFGGIDPNARGDNEMVALIGFGLLVVGLLTALAANIYLLATRSQSIGKWLTKLQIIDYATNEPANFFRAAILRGFVNGLIGSIPAIGGLYSLVDILFIFSSEHRCLHDHLAGTYVVDISSNG